MSPVAPRRSQMAATATPTINGPRPSPLKLNHNSHIIHKPSNPTFPVHHHHYRRRERREPVIIYTRSPKVFHTQPCDFMALVQKLTGLSRDQMAQDLPSNNQKDHHRHGTLVTGGASSDGSTVHAYHDNVQTRSFLDKFDPPITRIGDIPLYTPTGIDLLLSPTVNLPVVHHPDVD
ncbi:hypothetical protein Ancab_018506 [Ancistrocladus abbreviatus]